MSFLLEVYIFLAQIWHAEICQQEKIKGRWILLYYKEHE
jgi:hypothetical protein